jgi:hypothetical protein
VDPSAYAPPSLSNTDRCFRHLGSSKLKSLLRPLLHRNVPVEHRTLNIKVNDMNLKNEGNGNKVMLPSHELPL